MAISLSNLLFLSAALFLSYASAATRVYNFTAGWVFANPDGMFNRPTIGINGQWPLPAIEATVGDRVIVNLQNDLGNQSTSIHFHGLFMNGTNQMDGVGTVTQCPVPPGSSFTYDFNVRAFLSPFGMKISPFGTPSMTDTEGRSPSLARTGIIRTWKDNIQTDCVVRSSFTTRRIRMPAISMRS